MKPGRTPGQAAGERVELASDVALMRDLGVVEWNGIRLGKRPGPAPRDPTKEEITTKADKKAERAHDVMFAATSVRPPLPRG